MRKDEWRIVNISCYYLIGRAISQAFRIGSKFLSFWHKFVITSGYGNHILRIEHGEDSWRFQTPLAK